MISYVTSHVRYHMWYHIWYHNHYDITCDITSLSQAGPPPSPADWVAFFESSSLGCVPYASHQRLQGQGWWRCLIAITPLRRDEPGTTVAILEVEQSACMKSQIILRIGARNFRVPHWQARWSKTIHEAMRSYYEDNQRNCSMRHGTMRIIRKIVPCVTERSE